MRFPRRPRRTDDPDRLVRVAVAIHEPEAELLLQILRDAGIPAMHRRTEFDYPGMLAGGPRAILVPARYALEAHAILDPLPDEPSTA
jgi:hypothetical protein